MAKATTVRDPKIYPICDPWYGESGAPFERIFLQDFLAGIGSHVKDKYANGASHLRGMDPGGIRPPTAADLAANPNHPGTLVPIPGVAPGVGGASQVAQDRYMDALMAFSQRDLDTLNAIRTHTPIASFQSMLDDMRQAVEEDRPDAVQLGTKDANGAPIFPPVYSPGHPRAGNPLTGRDLQLYQQCGNSLSRHAMRELKSIGIKAASGLKTLTQQTSWVTLSMDKLGIGENSCIAAMTMIETLNREAGNIYADEEKRVKFLSGRMHACASFQVYAQYAS